MRKQMMAAALTLALAASGALASDIYKWVDENGNVQYGDRPDGNPEAQRLAIASRSTDPARVKSEIESVAATRAKSAERREAADADAATQAQARAEAEERAQKCASYRQTLQKLVTSRRLYRQDDNGERVYLDDTEAQAARERAEEQVNEYCNP